MLTLERTVEASLQRIEKLWGPSPDSPWKNACWANIRMCAPTSRTHAESQVCSYAHMQCYGREGRESHWSLIAPVQLQVLWEALTQVKRLVTNSRRYQISPLRHLSTHVHIVSHTCTLWEHLYKKKLCFKKGRIWIKFSMLHLHVLESATWKVCDGSWPSRCIDESCHLFSL